MNLKLFSSFFIVVILLLISGCVNNDIKSGQKEDSLNNSSNLKAPPNLTVILGELSVKPILGTYSWSYDNGDGTATAIDSDAAPPAEIVKDQKTVDVSQNNKVKLNFEMDPIDYEVRVWDSDNNILATYNDVDLTEYQGKVIYEILANWEQGTASYSFALNIKE